MGGFGQKTGVFVLFLFSEKTCGSIIFKLCLFIILTKIKKLNKQMSPVKRPYHSLIASFATGLVNLCQTFIQHIVLSTCCRWGTDPARVSGTAMSKSAHKTWPYDTHSLPRGTNISPIIIQVNVQFKIFADHWLKVSDWEMSLLLWLGWKMASPTTCRYYILGIVREGMK